MQRGAKCGHGTEKRWHSEERNRAGMDRLGDGIAEHGSDGRWQGEVRIRTDSYSRGNEKICVGNEWHGSADAQ